MKLKGMTEMDLDGILFVEFPDDMPMAESRDRLELLISEVYEEDCQGLNEDEYPELVMSPFMVMRALMHKSWKEFEKMSEEDKKRFRKEFWDNRSIRGIDKPNE